MAISVCIPCYADDPAPLLGALCAECWALGAEVEIEILVCDDGSPVPVSVEHEGVRLLRNEVNLGRVGTRRRLAEAAQHEYLLFVDVDSLPVRTDFLQAYLALASIKTPVAAGGTAYLNTPPADKDQHLRWHYGRNREQRTAEERQSASYYGLALNNLLINRDVFLGIALPNLGYGHEDTLLGYQLTTKGIAIAHVDNPVYHTGLESNIVFLNKALEGARTLAGLPAHVLPTAFVRLSNTYYSLKGFTWMLALVQPLRPVLKRWVLNLLPGYLKAMDVLKLLEYHTKRQ